MSRGAGRLSGGISWSRPAAMPSERPRCRTDFMRLHLQDAAREKAGGVQRPCASPVTAPDVSGALFTPATE